MAVGVHAPETQKTRFTFMCVVITMRLAKAHPEME
jgi:hypothetical protein